MVAREIRERTEEKESGREPRIKAAAESMGEAEFAVERRGRNRGEGEIRLSACVHKHTHKSGRGVDGLVRARATACWAIVGESETVQRVCERVTVAVCAVWAADGMIQARRRTEKGGGRWEAECTR